MNAVSLRFFVGMMMALAASSAHAQKSYASANRLQELLKDREYLAFRVFVRKNFAKIKDPDEWLAFRDVVQEGVDRIGHDLLYSLDRRPVPGLVSGAMNINEARKNGDTQLVNGRFEEAFTTFQGIAEELKRISTSPGNPLVKRSAQFLIPYIHHSMGRALYGARRFDEAYLVYRWIPQSYAKIRGIQFEKMWSAFRGGRIDHALGAVASQNSDFFSRYLSPESYLVQTYLYKKLCRESEYEKVLESMKTFQTVLKDGNYGVEEFAKSDSETLVLWRLSQSDDRDGTSDTRAERERIRAVLKKAYDSGRVRLQDDLEKALAYVRLTVRSGQSAALKPVEKLPDRQALFKIGLEIWPADSLEEWVDEIGSHRFVGESQCKSGV